MIHQQCQGKPAKTARLKFFFYQVQILTCLTRLCFCRYAFFIYMIKAYAFIAKFIYLCLVVLLALPTNGVSYEFRS